MGWVVNATLWPSYTHTHTHKRPDAHNTEGWVDPRSGLGGCRKSHYLRDSIPGPSIL